MCGVSHLMSTARVMSVWVSHLMSAWSVSFDESLDSFDDCHESECLI